MTDAQQSISAMRQRVHFDYDSGKPVIVFTRHHDGEWVHISDIRRVTSDPIPMRLTCPKCGELHVDAGDFATKPHHTHACQHCGVVWRPAIIPTVGVRFLPGFKD